MKISLVEPYCTGSHAAWAQEYAAHSRHEVRLLTLPGRNWKWRMHGGAVTLASRFLSEEAPDLILATDMLDLTTFLALTREKSSRCRCAIYFHENQLTYPWSPGDPDRDRQRDLHYAFINYTSALAADAVLFNSSYHMRSFLDSLPEFLRRFPDNADQGSVAEIAARSRVLPLGMDLKKLDAHRPEDEPEAARLPLILWNHRWEYDKAPEEFFQALYTLADEGMEFEVAVLGESFSRSPAVFKEARHRLGRRVVQWGYVESFKSYAECLWRADIVPVTSRQEFFGASVVQALYCNCAPLLPARLSYPEHVPPHLGAGVLYGEGEDLADRMRPLLVRGDARVSLSGYVSRYDWSRMAPIYDSFFEALAAGKAGAIPDIPPL